MLQRKAAIQLLVGSMLCAAALPVSPQLYRWTDDSGKTHFTDTVPPATAKQVERRRYPAPGGDPDVAGLPFLVQQTLKNHPVTLYTARKCAICDQARELLNSRGIPFKEISIASENQVAELKDKVGGNMVPSLLVGSSAISGFEESRYQQALDSAGYPKTGSLPRRDQREPGADASAQAAPSPAEAPAPRGPYAPR